MALAPSVKLRNSNPSTLLKEQTPRKFLSSKLTSFSPPPTRRSRLCLSARSNSRDPGESSKGGKVSGNGELRSGEEGDVLIPEVADEASREYVRRRYEEAQELSDWYAKEYAKPAERVWDLEKPQTYYFAIANAQSLLDDGALVEEVLFDAITKAQRGGRPRDVWMVMEPAFLDHPKLAGLKNMLRPPTAAILSTNGEWMMTIVRELLPQATIGKFYAPTESLPNPFKSNLQSGGAVIGGGAVWH